MLKCKLEFNHQIPGPAGSCGFDFWHSTPALEWINSYLSARPMQIQVTEENKKKATLFCLLRQLPCGLFLASAYPYGYIEGDVELFWQAVNQISQELRKHRVIRLEIALTGKYIKQLENYQQHSRIMVPPWLEAIRHVLNIKPAIQDPLWLEQTFGSKIRWAMRKAERSGGTVRQAQPAESTVIQRIYRKVMEAKGAPVNYGQERFQGIIEDLSPLGHGKIHVGYIDGEPAGFTATVQGQDSYHLVQVAVLPEKQSSRLSELLIGTTIKEAVNEKIKYFDFMASNKNDKGLIAFKAKWKSTPEKIYHAIIPSLPLIHYTIDLGRWLNKQKWKLKR